MKHTIMLLMSCFALSAQEAPKRTEPKNAAKLSVKIVGSGDSKKHAVTGQAGANELLVRWGNGKNDFFRVEPWETKSRTISLGSKYSVTASEDGVVVDTETPTRKTGLR